MNRGFFASFLLQGAIQQLTNRAKPRTSKCDVLRPVQHTARRPRHEEEGVTGGLSIVSQSFICGLMR